LLASASDDDTIRLWDLSNPNATPIVMNDHGDEVWHVAFSADGRMLASGGRDGSVRLWDLGAGDSSSTVVIGLPVGVGAVAFSPDGKNLVSGSDDGLVRLWDLTNLAAPPAILEKLSRAVFSTAFSPEGQTLATGGADGTVRLSIARTETLSEKVCDLVWRNLTLAEWQQFVGKDVPYKRTCANLPPGEGAPTDSADNATMPVASG